MMALLLVVLLMAAAFAVDLGMQRVVARDAQTTADVVALDMARLLDGRSRDAVEADPRWAAQRARTLAANTSQLGDAPQVQVEAGRIDPSTGEFFAIPGNAIPTGVRATVEGSIDFAFAPAGGGPESGSATRSAVATAGPSACFRLGSFALDLQTGESVLQEFFGDTLGTTVVGYGGLAVTTIRLGELIAALDEAGVEIGTGTPAELVAADVTVTQLLQATAMVLAQQDGSATSTAGGGAGPSAGATADTAAASIETTAQIAAQVAANLLIGDVSFALGDLIDLGTEGTAALDTQVNVLDLITGAAVIADGNSGVRIPSLDVGPLTATLHVTQAPVIACDRGVADTGQVELRLSGVLDTSAATAPVHQVCAQTYSRVAGTLTDLLTTLGLLDVLGGLTEPALEDIVVGGPCGQVDANGCTSLDIAVIGTTTLCTPTEGGCQEVELRSASFLKSRVAIVLCLGPVTTNPGSALAAQVGVELELQAATARGRLLAPPSDVDCQARNAAGDPSSITVQVTDKQLARLSLGVTVEVLGLPIPVQPPPVVTNPSADQLVPIPTPTTYEADGYTQPVRTGGEPIPLPLPHLGVNPIALDGLDVDPISVDALLQSVVADLERALYGDVASGTAGMVDRLGLTIAGADLWGVERPSCSHPTLVR